MSGTATRGTATDVRHRYRRWYATGFMPVTELNLAAEKVLEDLARRREARGGLRGDGRRAGDC